MPPLWSRPSRYYWSGEKELPGRGSGITGVGKGYYPSEETVLPEWDGTGSQLFEIYKAALGFGNAL